MANVVQFILKARDEATKEIKKVANEVGGLSGSVARLGASAGAWGIFAAGAATAAAAVVALGKRYVETVETLQRLSGTIGITTDEMQVFQKTMYRMGADPEQAAKALMFLNQAIGRQDPLLKQLGITTRNASEAYNELMRAFANSDDAGKKAVIAQKLLGKQGKELIGVAAEWNSTLADTQKLMRESNALYGEDGVKAAGGLDAALEELNIRLEGATRTLQQQVLPTALKVIEVLNGLLAVVTKLGKLPIIRVVIEAVTNIPAVKIMLAELDALAKMGRGKGKAASWADRDRGSNLDARGGNSLDKVKLGAKFIGYDEDGGMLFSDPSEGKESPREKAIKRLVDLLGVSSARAAQFATMLDAVESKAQASKVIESLRSAGMTDAQLKANGLIKDPTFVETYGKDTKRRGFDIGLAPMADEAGPLAKQKEYLSTLKATSEAINDVTTKWGVFADDVTSTAAMIDDAFAGLWSGLTSGFQQVFVNMLGTSQTLRSAMKTIFMALANEVMSILGRIAAAQIFKFVVTLIGGPTAWASLTAATAVGAAGGKKSMQQAGPDMVININAMDRSGVYASLTAPRGELRAAMRDAMLGAAY